MATLLDSADADSTQPLPMNAPATRMPDAGAAQVSVGRETQPPTAPASLDTTPMIVTPPPARAPSDALAGMVVGLVWTAAIWVGLALFLLAIAYPLSTFVRFVMMTAGGWLVAAGVAYAIAVRPGAAMAA